QRPEIGGVVTMGGRAGGQRVADAAEVDDAVRRKITHREQGAVAVEPDAHRLNRACCVAVPSEYGVHRGLAPTEIWHLALLRGARPESDPGMLWTHDAVARTDVKQRCARERAIGLIKLRSVVVADVADD